MMLLKDTQKQERVGWLYLACLVSLTLLFLLLLNTEAFVKFSNHNRYAVGIERTALDGQKAHQDFMLVRQFNTTASLGR
jgi:hypothetical protein